MIQIDDYSEHQLDRATSILIDLFERFTYDYDSMILYYKNTSISELQATVIYYGNIAKTIVDDSIESCEELRKFMENIGVEDTSIIDYIENILRKGGEVIDAAVKITERVNNDDQPTPDVTCSDSSDDYEDWEDEEEVTDEERDAEIEKIAPEPEVIKEMEETKKAEVDPAKVEEARAKQEEADKAAQAAAQARADANEAKAKAEEAKDAYNKAIEDLKDTSKGGFTVEKTDSTKNTVRDVVSSLVDLLTPGSRYADDEAVEKKAQEDIINNARAEGLNAAAEVLSKGGTAEEAREAYQNHVQEGVHEVSERTGGYYEWGVNLTPMPEDFNKINEAAEARDNAAKAELGAETAEEAAHAAENAANTAAEEAAEAVEEANNPPCADCDCDCDSCDSCDCDCDETPCDSTPCTDDTPPCSDDTCVGDCADTPCADTPCADTPCSDTPCADCADTPCPDCPDCASDTDVCPSDAYCDEL